MDKVTGYTEDGELTKGSCFYSEQTDEIYGRRQCDRKYFNGYMVSLRKFCERVEGKNCALLSSGVDCYGSARRREMEFEELNFFKDETDATATRGGMLACKGCG